MAITSQAPNEASTPSLSADWCRWCGDSLPPRITKRRHFCSSLCVADMLEDARLRAAGIRAKGKQASRDLLPDLLREIVTLRELVRKYISRGL